jgi:hypothetical protein
MKRFLIVLSVLVFAMGLAAQVRTGNVYGRITDSEGNPLPGVTVTLSGPAIAPMTTVTTAAGIYRFPSVPPSTTYEIAAELVGFKKEVRTNVIVQVGANVDIAIVLEVGTLEESITVVAMTPVVETKKTTVGVNIDKEALQSLPTARDPWTVIQLAPSVMVDRENIGGNESGQQSGFIARGDTSGARVSGNQGANNIWAVDGIDITDPAALGGSALYYDFDMFEEFNVTVGGAADVTVQTGGIALNMVTRRGGNRMSLAGRFYLTDGFFQSENMTDELRAQGVLDTNKIQNIKDFGFNAGGPIIKDKLWWWGAYGVQNIFVWTLPSRTGIGVVTPAAQSKSDLNNYNFKLNAQILPNNRFEALITSGAKEMLGRNASPSKPEGDYQKGKYYWGSPIIKLQDEHVFGNNFFVSLKYSFNDAGFGWRPVPDPNVANPIVYDLTLAKYVPWQSGMIASWSSYGVSRPRNNYQVQGSYFNDTLLNASHEFKFGAEYSHKEQSTNSTGTGYIQGFLTYRNYNSVQLDTNYDGERTVAEMAGWQRLYIPRLSGSASVAQQFAAYVQDTIVKGRFTLTLGLRYDKQWSSQGAYTRLAAPVDQPAWQSAFSSEASAIIDAAIPNVDVEPVKGSANVLDGENRPYQWNVLSPRIGLTWDIFGDGKTVARLALSQYGDIMGVGWYTVSPTGTGGSFYPWWFDGNADSKVDWNELYWRYSTRFPYASGEFGQYRYVPYQIFANSSGALTPEAEFALNNFYNPDNVLTRYSCEAYYSGGVSGYDWYGQIPVDYTTGDTRFFANRKAQNSARTREFMVTLEREVITDFAASVNFTYRKFDNMMSGYTYYPADRWTEFPAIFNTWAGYSFDEDNPPNFDIILDPRVDPRDYFDPGKTPYDANSGWYTQAGTIPATYYIGGTFTGSVATGYTWAINEAYPEGDPRRGAQYSSGDAAGRPYYLPSANWPTGISTRYSYYRTTDAYYNYMGLDFVLNKRLSKKWMMNASLTLQKQTSHWGTDWFNETNKWAFDGQAYGDWGGAASGKQSVLMYTRWMVKLSGLYQLPLGFNISGTFNAREGWRVPQYFTLYNLDAPNYTAGYGNTIYKQPQTADALPLFHNLTLRLEKRINMGQGRLFLMADCFNILNSNMGIRSYPKYDGSAYFRNAGDPATQQQYSSVVYNFTGLLNEILNPRIWRFGARFEF